MNKIVASLAVMCMSCTPDAMSFAGDAEIGSTQSALLTPVTYIAPGQTVTISAGETMELDNVSMVVEGTLVIAGGASIANPAVLRFVNVNEANFVGGPSGTPATDVGLWVQGAGRLVMTDSPRTSMANTLSGAGIGTSSVVLAETPVGWEVGGRIAIMPSLPTSSPQYWKAFDERTITAISGRTIYLDSPLSYAHPTTTSASGDLWVPEVIYLDRGAVIEGTASGRAHVHINSTATSSISYGAFRHLGPDGVMGRYPLHWHENGDNSRGTKVIGAIVEDSRNHGYVPHSSHGITIQDSVAYDLNSDAFWWDLGDASDDITWTGNMAAKIMNTSVYQLNGFTLGKGSGNLAANNVACGIEAKANKEAGFSWPEGVGYPNVWSFFGNLAHNTRATGLFIWQNGVHMHNIHNTQVYATGKSAVEQGAYRNGYQYQRLTAHDTTRGFELYAGSLECPRSEFVSLRISGGQYGVYIKDNAGLTPQDSVLIRHSTLQGSLGKVYIGVPSGELKLVDFVECDIDPSDVVFSMAPVGSVFRFQDGTSAWKMDHNGTVTSIATFWP